MCTHTYVCLCEYLQTRQLCFLLHSAKALAFVVTCARAASTVYNKIFPRNSLQLESLAGAGNCRRLFVFTVYAAAFVAIGRGCILFFLFSAQWLFFFIFIFASVYFRVCAFMLKALALHLCCSRHCFV